MNDQPVSVDDLFPQSEYENIDNTVPHVKCSVKKMAKGYQWEARINLGIPSSFPPDTLREEGTVDRALTLLIKAEKRLKEEFGTQDKKE
jgi:hypothetical protein